MSDEDQRWGTVYKGHDSPSHQMYYPSLTPQHRGNTVVNHIMCADAVVLFAPLAKRLQRIIDVSYTYGWDSDIIFNSAKSKLMLFYTDTSKYGHMKDILLGQNAVSVTKS